MNAAPPESPEEACIRLQDMANGDLSLPSNSQSLPTASVSVMEEKSTVNNQDGGNLASVQESSEMQHEMTSPKKLKDRIGEDGSFSPKRAPSKKKDGTYARPRGNCPKGFMWDSQRGVYAPETNGLEAKDDSLKSGSNKKTANGSSNGHEKPASLSVSENGNDKSEEEDQKATTPPAPSSTTSIASSSMSEKEEENDSKHYTRSKGGGSRSSKKSSGRQSDSGNSYRSAERITVDKSSAARSLNECAALLARVDDESYKRAVLQDASSILERIVFPMCFPWNHDVIPAIRNFPKDIDELPAILQADDDEFTPFQNGVYGYGGFEVGKERRTAHDAAVLAHGNTYLAATRRTDDVGVIELTVIDNEHVVDESSRLRKRKREVDSDATGDDTGAPPSNKEPPKDPSTTPSIPSQPSSSPKGNAKDDVTMSVENEPGDNDKASSSYSDYTLQSYQHAKKVKKQNVETAEDNSHRLMVSVRFGSVSSRSTVFAPNADTSVQPLLAQAIMPSRKNRNQVANYATSGWDVDRAKWLKRDNLAWTQSSSSAGGYLSKLTYNTMPSVGAKKPREVRVGIRLNGELLSYQPKEGDTRSPKDIAASILGVDDSFLAQSSGPPLAAASMCMLDIEKLMKERVKRPANRQSAPPRNPPVLDCVPLALCGGAIRVVCTTPGTLQPTNVSKLFSRPGTKICSVCWTGDGDVKECVKCGVQVHTSCCSHGGVLMPSTNGTPGGTAWMCAVCCDGPKPMAASSPSPRKRTSTLPARYQSDNMLLGIDLSRGDSSTAVVDGNLKCSLCPHAGGAMSPCNGSGGDWAHEVCRIWSQSTTQEDSERKSVMPKVVSKCALCGQEGAVIKCAGSDCTVRFHPMCAIVSVMDGSQQQRVSMDEQLSGKFTIDILECGDRLVPVGFCGFHNPSREATLYGCYPNNMSPEMRVPAVVKQTVDAT